MECDVIYFGMIAEKLGIEREKIDPENELADLTDLRRSIIHRHPQLEKMNFQLAVDGVLSNSLTGEAKLIAVLPPFAGG